VAAIGPDATFVNALRFDPYGQTVATWTATSGSVKMPWRYQGRILESAGTGSSTDLYDFSARSYDPSLGGFTSFDSVSGSAQNPLTLNRYLYANANPGTLVDPDGHCAYSDHYSGCETNGAKDFTDQIAKTKKARNAALHGGYGGMASISLLPTAAEQLAASRIENSRQLGRNGFGHIAPPHCNDVFGCANDFAGGFGDGVVNFIPDTVNGFAATLQNDANCLSFSSGCNLQDIMMPGQSMVQASIHQAATGDYRDLGHTAGNITTGIVVGAAVGAAADAFLPESLAARLAPLKGGACSFAPTTVVATATGSVAIAALKVGDTVMAYDPKTGETGPHPVTDVMTNLDPGTEHLATDTGSIDTTPNHPFFTTDRGWVLAGSLKVGEQIRTESGSPVTVVGFTVDQHPTSMWDLTVDGAHSFFVGNGALLVHNCDLSMDEALDAAINHVSGDASIGRSGSGAYQFISRRILPDGRVEISVARLDVNPASGHVQAAGPHLNLQVFIDGKEEGNLHIPIDPSSIGPGDYPAAP
jgi:RHS repeat-associated protein